MGRSALARNSNVVVLGIVYVDGTLDEFMSNLQTIRDRITGAELRIGVNSLGLDQGVSVYYLEEEDDASYRKRCKYHRDNKKKELKALKTRMRQLENDLLEESAKE